MADSLLHLALKVFVTHRAHNGTALLIMQLMSACDRSTATGRYFQNRMRRRLNRRFGCYVSPLARVGRRFDMPHPVGIVIGDGVAIGDDCVIYQNVTLGARRRGSEGERYPVLEDDVVVFAGAVILGPVRIGRGAVIAANAVVTHDVVPGGVAAGVPAVVHMPRPPDRFEPRPEGATADVSS